MSRPPPARFKFLLLGLLLTMAARASEGGFIATLSADQQAAAGLAALSPVERLTLDQLVAGELAAVRRPEAAELAGTFISRRPEAQRLAAGLDRLTGAQLARLDEYVAAALAARPKPKERPRLKESEVLAAKKPEIHGSVTLAYGWGGGGRDFWAESLWLDYYDPESRIGLGVGLTNFNGNGFYGYDSDYSGSGGRYYDNRAVSFAASYRGALRGDFSFGEGRSFCGRSGGFAPGPGGGRRH